MNNDISDLDYLDKFHGIFMRIAVHPSGVKDSALTATSSATTVEQYLDSARSFLDGLPGEGDRTEREVAQALAETIAAAEDVLAGR